MTTKSRWTCEAEDCPSRTLLRTSPIGGPFRGRCILHLETPEERAQLRNDIESAKYAYPHTAKARRLSSDSETGDTE